MDDAHPLKSDVSSEIIDRNDGHTPMRQRPHAQPNSKTS